MLSVDENTAERRLHSFTVRKNMEYRTFFVRGEIETAVNLWLRSPAHLVLSIVVKPSEFKDMQQRKVELYRQIIVQTLLFLYKGK